MGVLGNGEVVAPFANAAMRLLREDWKGKYGSKMLAEELFPILQTGIPNPDQNFQNFITINAGDDNAFASLIDKFGNKVFEITAADGLKPIEPPGYPPPKLKPRIVWGPKTIAEGDSIDAGELDAVAVDPETGAEVDGVYVYTPPDGTTFASPGTATLYVAFTPTDGVKYRKSLGSTVLTITGAPVLIVPTIVWSTPADIWRGTALSGTQLNATAIDPDTLLPVAGTFDYTPPAATVPDIGDLNVLAFFTPSNPLVYDVNAMAVQFVVKGIRLRDQATQSNPVDVEAGDLIVVGACYEGSAGDVTVAVSDGTNTYTQIGGYVRTSVGGTHLSTSLWRATAISSGTVTVTLTPAGSDPSLVRGAVDSFEGVLAFDSTSNGSGTGGETQTAGTCTVAGDRELVVVFGEHHGTGFAFKTGWSSSGVYAVGSAGNVGTAFGGATPTAPAGGASASVDPIASGTATDQWAFIAASFTHRTS